jgi:acyl carrier protein
MLGAMDVGIKMNMEKYGAFIVDLADILDIDQTKLSSDFKFPEESEWDSVAVISIIALVDEHFGVTLKANDLMELLDLKALVQFVEERGV